MVALDKVALLWYLCFADISSFLERCSLEKPETVRPLTRSERLRHATQQRRETEQQELRQAMLKAASNLFLEQGYEQFSLRQVAERIGYSPGTIYRYFKDKDDLLFTVVDEGFQRFGEQLGAVLAITSDPWQRLIALARAYITFGLQNPVYYQLMFMQRGDFLMRRGAYENAPHIDSFTLLSTLVQEAMDAGALRPGDAHSTSDAFWAIVHGVVALAIIVPIFDEQRTERMVETVIELLRRLP